MEDVIIIKSTGEGVAFDAERIRAGIVRAGGSRADADAVLADVRKELRDGMTTKALSALAQHALMRRNRCVACRYTLRDALAKLGPAGFLFEQYIAAMLARSGYQTELPEEYQGSCVKHEVDVLAKKDGKLFAIEAKFRNRVGDMVHLKDVMASYARFLDLLDGAALQRCPRFSQFWIVTNGKFSERAARFGACKGMPLIGWHHPTPETGLAHMIDRAGLYPVTILPSLTRNELAALADAQYLLCEQVANQEPVDIAHRSGLSRSRAEELVELASDVIGERVYSR